MTLRLRQKKVCWRMHEYSLAQSILHSAAEHADGAKVLQIDLVIGESSGILGESLRMYFDIFAENTLCEEAVIEIETVKPKLSCKACGMLFVRKPFSFTCTCGGEGEPTDIGREFFIKSITVDSANG